MHEARRFRLSKARVPGLPLRYLAVAALGKLADATPQISGKGSYKLGAQCDKTCRKLLSHLVTVFRLGGKRKFEVCSLPPPHEFFHAVARSTRKPIALVFSDVVPGSKVAQGREEKSNFDD
ncbi:hypothetical protein C8J57DRAFT_1261246 [Mycena rebaudengoi]|nr:hypothetical protein C8J57DRAFT_1261246 [Mycena rebaudengoi]